MMKKSLIFILLSSVFILQLSAKPNISLKFNRNGQFKIVQFTDTHIDLIKGANLEVYKTIQEIVEIENPDLVIFTGDVVTQDNPQKAFTNLADIFAKFQTPWATVFGNHESEHNLPRKQLADLLRSLPLCLNNVVLAYGRVTKKMKDAADPLTGGRVIVLKEGKLEFDTWIREACGRKVLECSYPGSFDLKK